MKRWALLPVLVLLLLLAGCRGAAPEATIPAPTTIPEVTAPETTVPEVTAPETTVLAPTEPPHSPLYLPGIDADTVFAWFAEVCLDGEIVHSGDPTVVQKWTEPIRYSIEGNPTEADLMVLEGFCQWLNTIPGFPGIRQAQPEDWVNLRICFTDPEGLVDTLGPEYTDMDGALTFWYDENDAIYDCVICIRTDLDQYLRNSVILEEIYNSLGPIQDTLLRPDSIIYQEFAQPQTLTEADQLILKLLYHPDIRCGMDAQQCQRVIADLYF